MPHHDRGPVIQMLPIVLRPALKLKRKRVGSVKVEHHPKLQPVASVCPLAPDRGLTRKPVPSND